MNPFYTLVADRASHRCEYCHAPELVFNFPFEVEHIIPLYRSGADAEFNLALACRSCNLHKGTRISGIEPESDTEIRLFHPRLSLGSCGSLLFREKCKNNLLWRNACGD